MTIKEMMNSGKWLVTLKDNTKWVVDLDKQLFDNYNWYKKVGTLESELKESNILKEIKTYKRI